MRGKEGVARSLARIGVVMKNRRFMALLLTFNSMSFASMAFISLSSYIYQDGFGVSSQVYSYYFAFNSVAMILGPYLYLWFAGRFDRASVVSACFVAFVCGGGLIVGVGRMTPWLFALAVLPCTVSLTCIRPPATYMMLNQVKRDAGSASALMGSSQSVLGSLGMVIVSFDLGNHVVVVGMCNVVVGLLCGAGWLMLSRRPNALEAVG
jgi:MFS transporter, DHA1 family, multidrug resistance protein